MNEGMTGMSFIVHCKTYASWVLAHEERKTPYAHHRFCAQFDLRADNQESATYDGERRVTTNALQSTISQTCISMRALIATSRCARYLRNICTPRLATHRNVYVPAAQRTLNCKRNAYDALRPRHEVTAVRHLTLCGASFSDAASTFQPDSIQVDVMVEGKNQVLDRCGHTCVPTHAGGASSPYFQLAVFYRQETDQLADAVRADGTSLMLQTLSKKIVDPGQCCKALAIGTAVLSCLPGTSFVKSLGWSSSLLGALKQSQHGFWLGPSKTCC